LRPPRKALSGIVCIGPVEAPAGGGAETHGVLRCLIKLGLPSQQRALLPVLEVVVSVVAILISIALTYEEKVKAATQGRDARIVPPGEQSARSIPFSLRSRAKAAASSSAAVITLLMDQGCRQLLEFVDVEIDSNTSYLRR